MNQKEFRRREIKRHILLVMSYIDIVLGMVECMLAIIINHNGVATDDKEAVLWCLLGLATILIGNGGIIYEGIIKARDEYALKRQRASI